MNKLKKILKKIVPKTVYSKIYIFYLLLINPKKEILSYFNFKVRKKEYQKTPNYIFDLL